jgi:hypothetical protein
MVDIDGPPEVAAASGAEVSGGAIAAGSPDPDSPEGRITAWTREHGPYKLTQEQYLAAWEGRPLPPPAD